MIANDSKSWSQGSDCAYVRPLSDYMNHPEKMRTALVRSSLLLLFRSSPREGSSIFGGISLRPHRPQAPYLCQTAESPSARCHPVAPPSPSLPLYYCHSHQEAASEQPWPDPIYCLNAPTHVHPSRKLASSPTPTPLPSPTRQDTSPHGSLPRSSP